MAPEEVIGRCEQSPCQPMGQEIGIDQQTWDHINQRWGSSPMAFSHIFPT
jgi:hypothetical protein